MHLDDVGVRQPGDGLGLALEPSSGRAQIIMEFDPTASRERILLLINNRLSQVTNMPEEADEPRLKTRDTDDSTSRCGDSPIGVERKSRVGRRRRRATGITREYRAPPRRERPSD